MSPIPHESDFPPGHPARFDFDPHSPEAQEWMRQHSSLKGERDFPVDHPKASDTPGNSNAVIIRAGVDPLHPEREAFTGRTPEQVAAMREVQQALTEQAKDTAPAEPIIAPAPPAQQGAALPTGQPGTDKPSGVLQHLWANMRH